MAYSGSKDFALTRDQIINAALRKIGEYDSLDGVPTDERDDAALSLNAMIKEWSAEGIGIWLNKRCTLILNPGVQRYSLGPTGTPGTTDNFHCFIDDELIEATGTAIEPAAETSIAVDDWVDFQGVSVGDPAASDVVGIRLADGTFHWSTVSSATNTTVVLNDGLPSASRVGSKVYTYTNRITRPHDILYANRESTERNSSQVDVIGRIEYERLSLKNSSGEPVKAYFNPQLNNTAPGTAGAELNVWPVSPPNTLDKLQLVLSFYADDFDAAGDNPQFPIEWANALIWNLADELASEYGVTDRQADRIERKALTKFFTLLNAKDVESASVRFGMDYAGMGHA